MQQQLNVTNANRYDTLNYDDIISSVLADNTRIAYEKGWKLWENYCVAKGVCSLPAHHEDIANFLISVATTHGANGKFPAFGTVILWRSAINRKHVDEDLTSATNHPHVVRVLKGLSRIIGKPPRQVKALREHHIKAMLACCPKTRIGFRDAAILVLGFSAALRRSEICNLTVDDIEMIDDDEDLRMFVHIRKSKTDQCGNGQKIAVPEGKKLRPIAHLRKWLKVSGIVRGHVFQTMSRGGGLRGAPMHHSDIPRLVKYYAERIGLEPSDIAAHSLRAGFVTSAAVHRARLDKIMEITRHRNASTVMKYIRDADSFNDHAGAGFL